MPVRQLIGFGAVLLFVSAGCGANKTGEYFYSEAKDQLRLAGDVSGLSSKESANIIAAFQQVVDRAPGTVWAARAEVTIGSIHLALKQHEAAREVFSRLAAHCATFTDLCGTARMGIAKSYEAEERWADAIRALDELARMHPWTDSGLAAPAYAARVSAQHLDAASAEDAYKRAVQFYEAQGPKAPTTALRVQATDYLVSLYQQRERWDQAIAVLEGLLKEPHGVNRARVLLELAAIYEKPLKNPTKAMETYSQIVSSFPDDPLAKVAERQLQVLQAPPQPHATSLPPPAAS